MAKKKIKVPTKKSELTLTYIKSQYGEMKDEEFEKWSVVLAEIEKKQQSAKDRRKDILDKYAEMFLKNKLALTEVEKAKALREKAIKDKEKKKEKEAKKAKEEAKK